MRRRYLFSAGPAGLRSVPEKEIWYTSTHGQAISLNTDGDLLLEYNLYSDGKGVMRFSNVVDVIPDRMFANSDGIKRLKTVWLPASVTKIGFYAFEPCSFLDEMILCGPPPYSNTTPVPSRTVVYVPDALVNDYMTNVSWGGLYRVQIRPWSEHI